MDWIQDSFNSWLGSNITYVANAYPKTIWVYFHTKKLDITTGSFGVSASSSMQLQLERQPNTEKVQVDFNDSHKKRRTDGR